METIMSIISLSILAGYFYLVINELVKTIKQK